MANLPQVRHSRSLSKVPSPFSKLSQDITERKKRNSQILYSRSLGTIDILDDDYTHINVLRREAMEGNVGSRLPVVVEEVNSDETLTVMNKIYALAKNPVVELQEWKNRKSDKITTKRRVIKEGETAGERRRKMKMQQGGCSCGPPGCCELVKANEDIEEEEEYEEADPASQVEKRARYSRQIITAFGKTQGMISRKTSRRKGKKTETAKQHGTSTTEYGQLWLDEEDEDEESLSPTPRIAWHPEFQYQPHPLCSYLLLSPQHEFSDQEIQRMRWFIDRMTRGLATPDEWLDDETQSAGKRESYRWDTIHPLRPDNLNLSPMTLFNRNLIIVRITITSTRFHEQPPIKLTTKISLPPPKARRASSPARPRSRTQIESLNLQSMEFQPVFESLPTSCTNQSSASSQPTAAITTNIRRHASDSKARGNISSRIPFVPVTTKEFVAGFDSPSQNGLARPSLEIDTSVHGGYQTRGTPNNTPQTPANHYPSVVTCDDPKRTFHFT